MMMYAAAAAAEEDRGWGGVVALLVGAALFVLLTRGRRWVLAWLDRRAELADDDEDEDLEDVDELLVDGPAAAPLWRRLADALWESRPPADDPHPLPSPTARCSAGEDGQVAALSPEPDSAGDSDPYDPYGHPQIVTLADGRRVRAYVTTTPPPSPTPAGPALAGELIEAEPDEPDEADLEEWVAQRMRSGIKTGQVVEAARRRWGVSDSTVYRAIRQVRVDGRHLPD